MSTIKEPHSEANINTILKGTPDFIKNTPLDNFFLDFNDNFLSKLNGTTRTTTDESVYLSLGFHGNDDFVDRLLAYFVKLHELTLQNQSLIKSNKSNLLPISLHDMRYLDDLISLLIIHGIDANIPSRMRIPQNAKQLAKNEKDEPKYIIPLTHTINPATLIRIVDTLYPILMEDESSNDDPDYIRGILLRGPIYTHLFLAILTLVEQNSDDVKYPEMLLKLENKQETYSLFVMYTLLIQELHLSSPTKEFIMNNLSTLPIRRSEDGLLSLVDFVLGVRDEEKIDINKFARVNQILMSKPKSMSNFQYLNALFKQIWDALTFINRPILVECVNGLIVQFFNKNKRIVRDFLFMKVYKVLINEKGQEYSVKELNDCINVMLSLSKNSSMELISDLVGFKDWKVFFLNIWIYALFLKKNLSTSNTNDDSLKSYYEVILSMLKSYMVLTNNDEVLNLLSLNLVNFEHENWKYAIDLETKLPYIITSTSTIKSIDNTLSNLNITDKPESKMDEISQFFKDMDIAVALYIELLKLINDDEAIKKIFLIVLNRWVKATRTSDSTRQPTSLNEDEDIGKNVLILIDLKLLEQMNQEFKTDIIKKVKDILVVIDDLIDFVKDENEANTVDSDDEEEEDSDAEEEVNEANEFHDVSTAFNTLLELLSSTISNSTSSALMQEKVLLESINRKLMKYINKSSECQRLHDKIENILNSTEVSYDKGEHNIDEKVQNDQELLDRAMINLSDPMVPIKAHGLVQLRQLVETKSSVIQLDKVLQLHLQYLKSSDPFIYMNATKGLVSLLELEPTTTMDVLLQFYENKNGKNKLDDILKVGEVFINYIQFENELFEGKYANLLIDTCLSKIRRYKELDNRIRMSSMSILGVCLQVNAAGVQSRIAEMVDCAIGILQLETDSTPTNSGEHSFVMRRSAVHLIHDLINSTGIDMENQASL